MDLADSPQEAEFRGRVRAWLTEALPSLPWPEPIELTDKLPFWRRWQQMLFEGGYAGMSWPVEYGGQGADAKIRAVFADEADRAGAPERLNTVGEDFAGPTIIAFGTDEQKERFLRPILTGDELWCQLFSEPESGSDLASLRTRATRTDGGWRITGQKIWTSRAHLSTNAILLARTGGADLPRHKGLSYFLLPLDSDGVTVRPLVHMLGEAEFNEVFLDEVRIPAENVVGGVDNGWGTALTVLMYERLTIGLGSEGFGYRSDRFAEAIGTDEAAKADPEVRQRLGNLAAELLAVRFTGYRTLTALAKGQIPGPESGLAKVTTVNAAIAAGELIADVQGPEALSEDSEWAYLISFLPGLKSAGGTEAILRNTIGERVLGLPPEPRLDKGIPFSELRAKEKEAVSA